MLFRLTKFKPYDVYRYSQGAYVNGEWVKDNTPEVIPILANIQPTKYSTVIQMPESDRTQKMCTVFTETVLREKKEGVNGYDGDKLYWQGDLYEIRRVRNWDINILNHIEAVGVRVELTPDEGEL